MVVALGRQADTCAAKTSSGDCAGVSGCSWNSGTSLCDVADATVKSIVGVETLAGVFSTWNTCQIKEPVAMRLRRQLQVGQRQLRADQRKSRRDARRRHGGRCLQDVHLRWYLLHELPRIGRYYIWLKLVRLLFHRETTREDGTTLRGQCLLHGGLFYHTVAGQSECFYLLRRPRFTTMLNEAYPGYDKRCPNVIEQVNVAAGAKCEAATTEASGVRSGRLHVLQMGGLPPPASTTLKTSGNWSSAKRTAPASSRSWLIVQLANHPR